MTTTIEKPFSIHSSAYDVFKHNRDVWIENFNIIFTPRGWDTTLIIKDMTNAYKKGKNCKIYTFVNNNSISDFFNEDFFKKPIIDIISQCETEGFNLSNFEFYMREEKGVRCFNPNTFHNLKNINWPNKSKKLRLSTVIKLIANNKVIVYRDYKYTDDYAYDASTNYGKGIADPIKLAKDLIESPDGWWCYVDNDNPNIIYVSCYNFMSYSLYRKESIK